jgi:hypothetical protein
LDVTKHGDLFARLAQRFKKSEIKTRPQGKTQIRYITARVAMNRLDEVIGPENWWDRYTPGENSVLCELTVRLPDGSTLTKCDAGGYAGMADSGDDDKSGYSDAFKRAAVKFGVGRYLYGDGVPDFVRRIVGDGRPGDESRAAPAPTSDDARMAINEQFPARRPVPPNDDEAGEVFPARRQDMSRPEMTWPRFADMLCGEANRGWLDEIRDADLTEEQRRDYNELLNVHQLTNHVCSYAIEKGSIKSADVSRPTGDGSKAVRDDGKAWSEVGRLYSRIPERVARHARDYVERKRLEALSDLGIGVAGLADAG